MGVLNEKRCKTNKKLIPFLTMGCPNILLD